MRSRPTPASLLAVVLLCAACEPLPDAVPPRPARPDAGATTGDESPRGPSTQQEREAAVETSKRLEDDPMAPGADEERGRLTVWVMQIPDILVKTCTALVSQVDEGPTRSVLNAQMLIGSAAFLIQHPDRAKDDVAVYTAGLESALRAYVVMVKGDPSVRTTYLDDLVTRQRQGKLGAYVREVAKDCSQ